MQKTQCWLSQKLTKVQGRRKGGGAGGHRPPCPLVRGAGGAKVPLE
jgi:hypothetical protein